MRFELCFMGFKHQKFCKWCRENESQCGFVLGNTNEKLSFENKLHKAFIEWALVILIIDSVIAENTNAQKHTPILLWAFDTPSCLCLYCLCSILKNKQKKDRLSLENEKEFECYQVTNGVDFWSKNNKKCLIRGLWCFFRFKHCMHCWFELLPFASSIHCWVDLVWKKAHACFIWRK